MPGLSNCGFPVAGFPVAGFPIAILIVGFPIAGFPVAGFPLCFPVGDNGDFVNCGRGFQLATEKNYDENTCSNKYSTRFF